MAILHNHWGTFNDAVAKLRQIIPIKDKISVRRVYLASEAGSCNKVGKKFIIKICKTLPTSAAILVLIHEFAHVLAWDRENDHDAVWGRCYAKCWRAFTKDL